MGQVTFNDVCDSGLPSTSQRWYQLTQCIIAGAEVVAIILFIYTRRNTHLFQQTLSKSPFLKRIFLNKLTNIQKEIIIDHNTSTTHSRKSSKKGYESPKLPLNLSQKRKVSFSTDSSQELSKFSLNNLESSDEYYNDAQNQYWIDHDNERNRMQSLQIVSCTNNKETLAMIESNTDKYRIYVILLPMYYILLMFLCCCCFYKMLYMALLGAGIGNNFGQVCLLNFCFLHYNTDCIQSTAIRSTTMILSHTKHLRIYKLST